MREDTDSSKVSEWSCLLCGHKDRAIVIRGPDYEYDCMEGIFTLAQCSRCGHVSIDPLPGPGDIACFYPATYYTVNPRSPLYLQGFIYSRKIRRDVQRILSYAKGRRLRSIVDIGCGDSERLFLLRKMLPSDTACLGVDLQFQPAVVERAKAEAVDLVQGNVESDLEALHEEGHDFIIMSQLLEHLRDPIAALVRIRRKLAPGGFLLIETPHLGGLDYVLFGRRFWGGYHLPRHFHLFVKNSLVRVAEEVGYRMVQHGSLPSPGFWIISLRNMLGLNSVQRGNSPFEFLNFSNVLAVGTFTALDLVAIAIGASTSNQFALLSRA